jgi:hypothetical protein
MGESKHAGESAYIFLPEISVSAWEAQLRIPATRDHPFRQDVISDSDLI